MKVTKKSVFLILIIGYAGKPCPSIRASDLWRADMSFRLGDAFDVNENHGGVQAGLGLEVIRDMVFLGVRADLVRDREGETISPNENYFHYGFYLGKAFGDEHLLIRPSLGIGVLQGLARTYHIGTGTGCEVFDFFLGCPRGKEYTVENYASRHFQTYSLDPTVELVMKITRTFGLSVRLGAWINKDQGLGEFGLGIIDGDI